MPEVAPEELRVVLADDHAILREGLARLIRDRTGYRIVAQADDAAQAVEHCARARPHLAILDFAMPGGGGLRATREIRERSPETGILILSMHSDPIHVRQAMQEGADGYLYKGSSEAELLRAIQSVLRRKTYLDPALAGETLDSFFANRGAGRREDLSAREEEVLRHLAQGRTNAEIAGMLNLSVKTVETYRARIKDKLGLAKRSDIVTYVRNRDAARGKKG